MKISIVKVVKKTYMDGKYYPKDENLLIENEKTVFVFGIPVYRNISFIGKVNA